MSVEQARRNLNRINKDIASIENKLAAETKNEAGKNKRINDIQKSINKNTSLSMLQSKTRQMQGYQNDLVNILSKKSDLNKKLADKRSKLSDATLKLQKEEQQEAKKMAKANRDIMKNYESKINSLTSQLEQENIARIKQKDNSLYSDINDEVYDVFVSHASEDKEDFVDEFCSKLNALNIKVWYDTMSIKWGDSLRTKIDDGLRNSKYGVVVISPSFINKGWTQYELEGLFQIEMTGGKTILPIWHNITKKEVQDFSPTLSGRKALTTAIMTPSEIAEEFVKLLQVES